jgi:hypothetical protein
MAIIRKGNYHEDSVPKRKISDEEIKFLRELQKEMNTQDTLGQRDPRYWVIRGTERIYHIEPDGADGIVFYYSDSTYTEDEFKNLLYDDILPEIFDDGNYRYEYEEDGTETSLEIYKITNDKEENVEWLSDLEEIIEYLQEQGYDISYSGYIDMKYNYPGPVFLTNKAANEHLKENYYHYSEDAHPYALTAWRCPEIETLYEILHNVDFGLPEEPEQTEQNKYNIAFIDGRDNSYKKYDTIAKMKEEALNNFNEEYGASYEHRILYIKENDKIIYEF